MKKHINIFIILVVLNCASCFQNFENKDWENTRQMGTIDAYKVFMNNYPDSEYKNECIKEIWKIVEATGSLEAYEYFYNDFTESDLAKTAMERIWAYYSSENTLEGYNNFLRKYYDSDYKDTAREGIKELWRKLKIARPKVEINSDMEATVSWNNIDKADSYILVWSKTKINNPSNSSNKISTGYTSYTFKNKKRNGDGLPMYYYVFAVKDGTESLPSEPVYVSLGSSNNGNKCQICGSKSVGYCHLRNIYVCSDHNVFNSMERGRIRCP